jgi:hypothetical protein
MPQLVSAEIRLFYFGGEVGVLSKEQKNFNISPILIF